MKNALQITSTLLYKSDFQLTESDGQNWSKKEPEANSRAAPKTIQSYLLKNADKWSLPTELRVSSEKYEKSK